MKITELDLKTDGKRYKYNNKLFTVKDGDLVDTESNTYLRKENISITKLLEMDFEEIKKSENPYERVDNGGRYYIINSHGSVQFFQELNDDTDNRLFNALNYFNNKNYAEYVVFKENLMRKLDKFAWENNARVVDCCAGSKKYYITLFSQSKELMVDWDYGYDVSNTVYFTSHEIAVKALEEFKEDLMKFYTWEFDF